MLTKEFLDSEQWRVHANELEPQLGYHIWTDEELRANRDEALSAVPADVDLNDGVWVFAYGSLIWNPLLDYDEKIHASITGFTRKFCLVTRFGRGSPEKPGLVLALDEGGFTRGVAFHVRPENLMHEMFLLWRREMLSGSYKPIWMSAQTKSGDNLTVLSFAMNRDCPRYTGEIALCDKLRMLSTGEGILGSSREYFDQTLSCLRSEGIHSDYLEGLAVQLDAKS